MKKLKKYSEILESVKRYNVIFEKSLSPDKIDKINRLKDSGDLKMILNDINELVLDLKERLLNIDFDDIEYSYEDDIISLSYSDEIHALLVSLRYKTRKSSEEIEDKIFGNGWKDLFLEIEIDTDMFNRIDIMNGLPKFIKGIGLGKKIYKKLIKDFNYISSFDGYEPSIDSSMVWESIARDEDIFTFSNGDNLISFWNNYSYNDIINVLKLFYKNGKGEQQYDDSFLKLYNLDEDHLRSLIS